MKRLHLCALAGALLILGVALIVVGAALIQYFNSEIKKAIEKGSKLANDSFAYKKWMDPSSSSGPRFESFYLFNVTNPKEAAESGKNITVKQTGPYVYRVSEKKTKVSFDKDMKTLTFNLMKQYTFDRSASFGDENDTVVTINIPIMSLLSKLRSVSNSTVTKFVQEMLTNSSEHLFTEVRVIDLVWGYNNQELEAINNETKLFRDTTIGVYHQVHITPGRRSLRKYSISTGNDDLNSAWNILKWNGSSNLSYWKSDLSNLIRGTDGFAWHPYLEPSEPLHRFDPDWCRSVYLSHESQSTVDDLTADRFVLPPSVLNSSLPDNEGFCRPTPDNGTCLGIGLLDISPCTPEEIPWILSQPHFYEAEAKFSADIEGLNPQKSLHENRFDVEMSTGEVIEAKYRRQYSMFLINDTVFKETTMFHSGVVVPVAWIDEEYSMSPTERDRIHSEVIVRRQIFDGIQYGLIGLGAAVFVLGFLVLLVFVLRKKTTPEEAGEREPLLQS